MDSGEKRSQRDYTLTFKLSVKFFEDVVDVLKNDYGISIVKKRPGKSLRKPKP